MNTKPTLAWIGVLALLSSLSLAQSSSTDSLETAKLMNWLMDQHKTTLQKAIGAAERRCKGRALRAVGEIDSQRRLNFHIHCLANGLLQYVHVDGETGRLSMAEVSDLEMRVAPGVSSPTGTGSLPSTSSPSSTSNVPTISLAELEFKGKDYLNKRVRISNCQYSGGGNFGALYSLQLHQDKHFYTGIYVDKDRMADVLVLLKSGMQIHVSGIVQSEDRRNRYVLHCDAIEIVPSP